MTRPSQDFQCISTSPPVERACLLKKLGKLKELPDNSTDTESDDIIKRYQRRPKQLEKLCLADFVACLTVLKIKEGDSSSSSNDPSATDIDDFLPETNFEDNSDNDPDSINVIESEYKPNEYKLQVGIKLVKRKSLK